MEEKIKNRHDFDWVKARFACSPFAVFEMLRLGCERDVKDRNELGALRPGTVPAVFEAVMTGGVLMVLREGHNPASVEFSWSAAGIVVRHGSQVFLQAALTLNDDGECRLKVGGDKLTCWQFRNRALEDLFFGD